MTSDSERESGTGDALAPKIINTVIPIGVVVVLLLIIIIILIVIGLIRKNRRKNGWGAPTPNNATYPNPMYYNKESKFIAINYHFNVAII